MNKFFQGISIVLIAWIGFFTQLSIIHPGHGHELLAPADSICSDTCEENSHHQAGKECEWFLAKRVVASNQALVSNLSTTLEILDIQAFKSLDFKYCSYILTAIPKRGPPL